MVSTNGEERVLKRLETLSVIYQENFKSFKGVFLSLELLYVAVVWYFRDLDSMKLANSIDFADRHKRAAFIIQWIINTRPIQVQAGVKLDLATILINENFALHAGLSHLKLNIADISAEYTRNLIYTLRLRQPSHEILASTMYLLECACNCKKP